MHQKKVSILVEKINCEKNKFWPNNNECFKNKNVFNILFNLFLYSNNKI